jgi:hypothetical protein
MPGSLKLDRLIPWMPFCRNEADSRGRPAGLELAICAGLGEDGLDDIVRLRVVRVRVVPSWECYEHFGASGIGIQ